MLAVPESGFQRSVNKHNVDLITCCDWLEASALFSGDAVSGSDAVDVLRESEIYADQNFAWELIADAFAAINERGNVVGEGYPFKTDSTRLEVRGGWKSYPAYSFCLALSLSSAYPGWARAFGKNHTDQGALFEKLTAESLKLSLLGWDVHVTGWSRKTPAKLQAVVAHVAKFLGETVGDVKTWSAEDANEAGLDIVCCRTFPDQRGAKPAFITQCASGKGWEGKLKEPSVRVWAKLIDVPFDPKKAFSMPFALSDGEYKKKCLIVEGLLLDRHRLLAPGHAAVDWVSGALKRELNEWTNTNLRC
jgi:hypothetical protein